jgi:hypothetical protein
VIARVEEEKKKRNVRERRAYLCRGLALSWPQPAMSRNSCGHFLGITNTAITLERVPWSLDMRQQTPHVTFKRVPLKDINRIDVCSAAITMTRGKITQ